MPLRKKTDATVEPVTLAEAKAQCSIPSASTEWDTMLTAMIPVARQACEENELRRTLIQSDWILTLDAFPDAIPLRMSRVMSVTSINYVDAAGITQLLAPSEYKVDTESEPGWIVPAFGKSWPATRDEINAVTVEYRCGYGTAAAAVPAPIKHWILMQVAAMFDNRATVITAQGITTMALPFAARYLDTFRNLEY